MSNYEERAKKFIAQIYPFIKDCHDDSDFAFAISHFNKIYHRNVRMAYGSTRIAMITSDYVVKIDYDGWGTGRFGSCKDEVRMYRRAVKEGYAYLLAKITPYRKDYNRTFYIMPKISGIEKRFGDAEEYLDDDEYDWLCSNIYDRHNQNYGWKNGHIVMIDYACNALGSR